ncbi:MAG: hypothetical protein UZ13_00060 [Chloroflexi bacterium OLB13]|nr:MAG: hypothetical protein UZ13_00060 [Chloroflexi bacterium OLB13]
MNDTRFVRHTDDDGSIYAVEVVSPEHNAYDAKYGVDLVRASTDRYGMEHEQRLRLGEYSSWGSAEEHQREVETALEKDGLDGLSDDARRVAQMPYLDRQYLAMVFPTDDSTGDSAKVHLLYLSGEQVTAALVADGRSEDMEALYGDLDRAWVEGGNERLLTTAQHEAETRGQVAPGTPLFDAAPNPDLPNDLPFTFGEGMQPFDAQGVGHAHHVDGSGTAHWFAVVENRESEAEPAAGAYELRYFRALETGDGTRHHDSYPVMPLPDDDPGSAWPLPGLEMYLQKGDVYMAQQFAHDVADHYGQAFPDPLDLPALNPEPEYYFGYGVSDQNHPALEAVKTWMHGSERRFDTFTIAEYGMWDEAQPDESELESTLKTQGLEAAMNQAERMAVAGGYLDPYRTDGRVFFEEDAPPDPFTTERTRAMERDMQHDEIQRDPEYSIDAISANDSSHLDVTKAWDEDQHAHLIIPQPDWETARANAETAYDLLDKDNLQGAMTLVELAGIEAGVIDPQRDDPRLFTEGPPDPFTTIRERELTQTVDVAEVTLKPEAADYPAMYRDFVAEAAREREANATLEGAAWFEATFEKSDIELLQPVNDTVNYAVVVQGTDPWTRELMVEKYWKEPGGYLGLQSVTLDTWDSDDEKGREQAEQEREALLEVHNERGLEAVMRKAELTAMQNDWLDGDRADPRLFTQGPPDRFETLAQQLEGEINPYWNTDGETIPEPEGVVNPYWRMDTLPVNDPDGKPLGHALHMVVYPNIEHDPDAVGTPAMAADEPFQMLEIAHFETIGAVDRFSKEFNGYLMPGLLEGPELAVEVARLEGLSAEWKTLEGDDLKSYQNADLTLTRDPSDWHPYNPHAERDARIAAEGVYSDPIQQTFKRDEPETASGTPELDF